MATSISATRAAREFSDVLARVRYRGEEFIVEKAGEPMCRLLPVSPTASPSTATNLAQAIAGFPKPDAAYLQAVRRVARRQPKLPKSAWGR